MFDKQKHKYETYCANQINDFFIDDSIRILMARILVNTQNESHEHNCIQQVAKSPTYLSVSFTGKRKSQTDCTENYIFFK